MKKIIGLVAVLAAVVLGAVVFMAVANNPEKNIVGEWINENNKYSLKFSKNGDVDVPVELFDLGFDPNVMGRYSVDKKAEKVTFSFSVFKDDHTMTCGFVIIGDSLTLTDDTTGKSTVFVRRNPE